MLNKFRLIKIPETISKTKAVKFVSVGLGSHFVNQNGDVTLSSDLATEQEVDYSIDKLIKELEFLRKLAKESLKK